MRKFLIVVLTVICAFSAFVTCYAATETFAEDKPGVSMDVVADYVKNTSDPKRFYCEITDDKASVTADNGTTVSVSGVQADGLTLVVLPITQAETVAWEWFESCFNDYGTNIYPMDIYFIDKNGNRVEYNRNFAVSITTPEKYTNPEVFYLSTDGKKSAIKCSADGKTVSFETNHDSYYVVAEKALQTPGAPSSPQTGAPSSPQTGDNSDLFRWIAWLFVSGTALAGMAVYGRMKRYSK